MKYLHSGSHGSLTKAPPCLCAAGNTAQGPWQPQAWPLRVPLVPHLPPATLIWAIWGQGGESQHRWVLGMMLSVPGVRLTHAAAAAGW